jgi:hypothetical protein
MSVGWYDSTPASPQVRKRGLPPPVMEKRGVERKIHHPVEAAPLN